MNSLARDPRLTTEGRAVVVFRGPEVVWLETDRQPTFVRFGLLADVWRVLSASDGPLAGESILAGVRVSETKAHLGHGATAVWTRQVCYDGLECPQAVLWSCDAWRTFCREQAALMFGGQDGQA